MIENIIFLNEKWFWPIISLGLLMWIILIGTSWFSGRKKGFPLKIITGSIAISALVLIAMKPATISTRDGETGVLLTQGYSENQLDSLKKAIRDLVVLDYSKDLNLSEALDSLTEITILGSGVKSYDLWQFDSIGVQFLPGQLPNGIIKLNYPKEASIGDKFSVDGVYHSVKVKNRVVLQDPGGTALDSTDVNAGQSEFNLQTILKATGKLVYRLVEKDSTGSVLHDNPLPLNIIPKVVLNVLVLNDFPSFETKYLKNFLAENGHKVLIRSKITKGRYKYEYLNRDQISFADLSQPMLEDFDLLIIDYLSLKNLSNSAKNGLQRAVFEDGLGVFVQADASFFRSSKVFPQLNFDNDIQTSVRLTDFPRTILAKSPFIFKKSFDLEIIHTSDTKILSAYKRNGIGRLGTTVLETSYQLLLNGKKDSYDRLWTQILSPLAKPQTDLAEWAVAQEPLHVDEPLLFQLHTTENDPEVRDKNGNPIALKQNFDLPEKWEGRTYPNSKGWQQLQVEGDTTEILNYFVLDAMDWKPLSNYKKMEANKNYFKRNKSSVTEREYIEPINLWWFYGIFLLTIGYMWLEPKLFIKN
ncbi:hypothetical protein [Flavimarina sp. Hel_I_48]|uniref:hypothetical protein n=1 Tax=Flavimarina sp. Hel_I_48 TaxID=1392488 RepID=UPI0004DF0C28|nr:hypothetical protein [Flavimarina sp. Hel_I_48]